MKRILILIIVIVLFLFMFFLYNKGMLGEEKNEENMDNNVFTPQENFEESLTAEVIIYFLDNNNSIISETKEVEANELINNPYKYVLELLKNEESRENRINVLKKEVEFLSCKVEGDILKIRVTNNFLEIYNGDITVVKEILKKTVCQFKEISDIMIENENGEIL